MSPGGEFRFLHFVVDGGKQTHDQTIAGERLNAAVVAQDQWIIVARVAVFHAPRCRVE